MRDRAFDADIVLAIDISNSLLHEMDEEIEPNSATDSSIMPSNKSDKPRRLDGETAAYLVQIEGRLQSLSNANDDQDIEILIENVLQEAHKHIGSAMSDRRTNIVLEKIILSSSMAQLLTIMSECSPYVIFLSTNRHSAHCLEVRTNINLSVPCRECFCELIRVI